MNSAVQTLVKTLGNLESQEKQFQNQLAACEKEMAAWKQDLALLLTQKAEIQLAIALLEGDTNESTSKSKKTKSASKNS